MDPVTLNTLINTLGLILTALIGAAGLYLSARINKIDETVKIIKVDVDGKLEQILRLTARAERAEGRGEARAEARAEGIEAAAVAALAAVPQAVTAALTEAVAPPQAGEVIKVVVEGTVPE